MSEVEELVKRLRIYSEHPLLQGYIMGMFRPGLPSHHIVNDIAAAAAELESLRAWKNEALEVERSWDAQAIAKLLDLKPGDDIRAAIQSAIESLRASLRRVEEERDADGFALEAAAAWLERWAAHVGHCRGGSECTCGLTAIRRDVQTRCLSRASPTETERSG